jgi:hypothetical protein
MNFLFFQIWLVLLISCFLKLQQSILRKYGSSNNLSYRRIPSIQQNQFTLLVVSSDKNDVEAHYFGDSLQEAARFLGKAALVGVATGSSVVFLKDAIAWTSALFYEHLADLLPKPSFYWPLALCKLINNMIIISV